MMLVKICLNQLHRIHPVHRTKRVCAEKKTHMCSRRRRFNNLNTKFPCCIVYVCVRMSSVSAAAGHGILRNIHGIGYDEAEKKQNTFWPWAKVAKWYDYDEKNITIIIIIRSSNNNNRNAFRQMFWVRGHVMRWMLIQSNIFGSMGDPVLRAFWRVHASPCFRARERESVGFVASKMYVQLFIT